MIERLHTDAPQSLRLIAALRDLIPHLMAKHETPGLNLALADQGRLVWEAGFGVADIGAGAPMAPDTIYRSGSLGKVYTGVAVMRLVDEGVLALRDPINRHLPFPVNNPLGDRDITVFDLMTHSSGLGPDAAMSSWTPRGDLAGVIADELARPRSRIAGDSFPRWMRPVGRAWIYSNLGVAILGLIVQTANRDGLDFPAFVKATILDPLGLGASELPVAQHPAFARADLLAASPAGYARMGGADIPSLPVFFHEYPAGGMLARPADHLRLLLAMMNGGALDGARVLAPETAAAMVAPALTIDAADVEGALLPDFGGWQGLIFRINDHGRPHWSFDHGGGHMYGWRTQGRAWPAHGAALVVASNQWPLPDGATDVQELADVVGAWLRYRPALDPAARPRVAAALSSAALSPAALSYVRGALAAGAYRIMTGIEGPPPADAFETVLGGVRDRAEDFDAAAFRRGFVAVSALEPNAAAFRAFWGSSDCELSEALYREAFAALGGRADGFMALLAPSQAKPPEQA